MSYVTERVNRTLPSLGRAWGYAKTVLRGGAGTMRLASDVFNGALLFVAVSAGLKCYEKARYFYAQSGGIPDPRAFGCGMDHHGQCMAFLEGVMPTMHLRLYWLAQAWVAAILAVGFAVLCVGGVRWAYWRVHDYLAV